MKIEIQVKQECPVKSVTMTVPPEVADAIAAIRGRIGGHSKYRSALTELGAELYRRGFGGRERLVVQSPGTLYLECPDGTKKPSCEGA